MSNYTKTTNFTAKDSLTSGNPAKIVKGAEHDAEYNAIAVAVNSKSNTASPTFTGTVEIPALTLNSVLVTSTAAELNILDGVTATAAEINALDGITATVVELNYTDGVTSPIQAQIDLKAPITNAALVTPDLGTPSAGVLTNATGLPVSTGISGLASGVASFLATPSSANLLAAVTDETGTGSLVFATSPTLVTPALGTPTSATLTNATGLPIATGVSGLGTGVATFLATPSSANLAAAVTGGTGSGALVFATSPALVTPALGTPSALVGTNITGTAAGLTAGNVTTNANLTGAVTSVGNATSLGSFTSAALAGALTDETGTGAAVFATSPTLVTPALGTPSSAVLTNATGLPVATGISGLGSGVATVLATPSSANLAAAITDETGTGALVFAGSPALTGTPTIDGVLVPTIARTTPLAKAIRVALLGSASVPAPQVLDNLNLDMGTNNFSVVVQKRITTTRPAANEILYHKHNGTEGVIVTLLTTGIVRLTLNATNFNSTVALTSASNVEPVIIIPVVRETTTTAGSVTFVVDGVQLGDALVISARVELITNGNFDTDISNWTLATGSAGSIAWEATGKCRVTRVTTGSAYQAITLTAGQTLFVSCVATLVSGGSTVPSLGIKVGAAPTGVTTLATTSLSAGASGTIRVSYYSAAGETVYVHLTLGSANGTYDFDTVTSIDTHSVDNSSNLYLLGTSTTTTEGDYYDGAIYNRALSVTECLDYCLRGPALADVARSASICGQSNFITGTNADFSGASNWTGNGATLTMAYDSGDAGHSTCMRVVSTSTTFDRAELTSTYFNGTNGAFAVGDKVKVTFDYKVIDNTLVTTPVLVAMSANSLGALNYASVGVWQTFSVEVVLTNSSVSPMRVYVNGSDGAIGNEILFDNISLQRLGLCGHWPAFNAQTNTGQIFDQSGNKNHALLPASGATILGTPQSMRRQVRWTNTWAATNELQYIGGVNQAILPANAYIESIVGTVSGATPHDIIIGDGSDTDRYVTITTGLATGTTTFTLANRVTDGTNLKLTVDPDTDATMSIAWVITYTLLEG